MRIGVLRSAILALGLVIMASAAAANHDTDCEISGGTDGPGQLDCRLPDFVASVGSKAILTSSFVYTPSTNFTPATCAVGTMSVNPVGQWLSIDTTVLDASSPTNFQEVEVSVDPSGLAQGTYDGTVRISLTKGTMAPQCPSAQELTGTVSVRLRIIAPAPAPVLNPTATVIVALALGLVGVLGTRRSSRRRRARPALPDVATTH